MRLPAVWVKIGIGVSLLASGQALAVNASNDNLQCAAYMDIAVNDLFPLGAIERSKAKTMLVNRIVHLAALTVSEKEPASEVVTDFINVRHAARVELARSSGLNAMRLYTSAQLDTYVKALDAEVDDHCTKANSNLEAIVKTHSKETIAGKLSAVSDAMKQQGEK